MPESVRHDDRQGYWPREKMVAMDRAAVMAMARFHPKRASPEIRALLSKPKDIVTLPASPPAPTAEGEIKTLLGAAEELARDISDLKVLGRQVAMFLITERYGEAIASEAFHTIPEAATIARQKVAPVVAANVLTVEPTVACFTQIITAFVGDPSSIRHTRKDIIAICAKAFNTSVDEIVSARRSRLIVRPRQAAMYVCKRCTPSSFPEIGKSFGGRDHTTALHACRKLDAIVTSRAIDCGNDPRAWAAALAKLPSEAWASA